MEFVILKGEKTTAAVVDRVFGKLEPADAKRAEATLLRANPHLTTLAKTKAGTPIVIPTVPGLDLAAKSEAVQPAAQPVVATADELKGYLLWIAPRLDASKAELRKQKAILGSKDFKAMAKAFEPGATLAGEASQAVEARIVETQKASDWVKVAGKAVADLRKLTETLK